MNIEKKRTLIILDWDDTLFPTSWVVNNSLDLVDPSVRSEFNIRFRELDDLLYKMLCRMSKLGKVVIITNAMPEWVQLSGSMLRKTNEVLKKINIVSARKENTGKASMKDWKKISFYEELIKHKNKYNINNIISIGDADYELHALINLYQFQKGHYDRYLKSVQFKKNPSFQTLKEQLQISDRYIKYIVTHKGHLDLEYGDK